MRNPAELETGSLLLRPGRRTYSDTILSGMRGRPAAQRFLQCGGSVAARSFFTARGVVRDLKDVKDVTFTRCPAGFPTRVCLF